jgi:hypothetical protein
MESERGAFLKPFKDKLVVAVTPIGDVWGFLRKCDRSQHGGFGSLLLTFKDEWVIVRRWFIIKTFEFDFLVRLMCLVMVKAMITL